MEKAHTRSRTPRRRRRNPIARTTARWMYHTHLWLGVLLTVAVLLIGITGILLNHKRAFGLMPDPPGPAAPAFDDALPLSELARRAGAAVPAGAREAGIDRMDVRPGDGLVKVRFDDDAVTEATVDLATGEVLHVGRRNDVFLEKLHSGEIFGDGWVLLSDAAAVALMLLLISGYGMWLYPRGRL
ncbi:MAG TPA: PepSY domain-containing protein [Longimicrobiales bacterium]|nr:PepSY domain-containing protein [Longimicrobiales bacterium]